MTVAYIHKIKSHPEIIVLYFTAIDSDTGYKTFDSVSEAIVYCDMLNYVIIPNLVYMLLNAVKDSPDMWNHYLDKYESDIKSERCRLLQNLEALNG
jgi:hypothetical protein